MRKSGEFASHSVFVTFVELDKLAEYAAWVEMLLDGFEGKLTTVKWAKIANCSHDTALRDIQDLIERRILTKDPAGGRSTSYSLLETAGSSAGGGT